MINHEKVWDITNKHGYVKSQGNWYIVTYLHEEYEKQILFLHTAPSKDGIVIAVEYEEDSHEPKLRLINDAQSLEYYMENNIDHGTRRLDEKCKEYIHIMKKLR